MNDERITETATLRTLSVQEAASMLGISRRAMYELADRDGVPVIRIGRRIRIVERALVEWANGGGEARRRVESAS
jgi:excisionase family DNA binding protein